MAALWWEITFLNWGSIVAQEFNEISSSSVPNLAIEWYVLKWREVTYTWWWASVLMKDWTSITSWDDSLKVWMIINNSLVDKYISQDWAFMLSAHFEQLNPTISQLHIDWVTYDLRDRNAGEWVTTEEKAKLAALPEAAEIPSDIGPKSEVVEEVPSEYVAGKVYFIVEGGATLKTYEELIAYTDAYLLRDELNSHPKEYYDKLNSEWHIKISAQWDGALANNWSYVMVAYRYPVYDISENEWFMWILSPDAP